MINQRKIFRGFSQEKEIEAAMPSTDENSSHSGVFWTPPPKWETHPADVPMMPRSESNARRSLYHVHHKVPPGDSPYGIAKRVQLVDKDPSKAVSLFWAAINSGDRVDSALKDMAVVMKQLNRSDEAIEAIKSFRHLCPLESQESLDNVLLELYKRSGKLQEEIQMLQVKLKHIEDGICFRGKRTKVGRSQGRKVHITIEKEYSRLLGNLAWAYLQQKDYRSAEEHYRKALSLEPDKNKQCNLAICLMHLNKMTEAKILLQTVKTSCENGQIDDSFSRSFDRAIEVLGELESDPSLKPIKQKEEMYGEIQTSLLSRGRRKFRGPSQPANANKLPGFEILKKSAEVLQDEMLPLIELNGVPSLLQNLHDSGVTLSDSKRRNVKGTLSGGRRLSNGQEEEDFSCMKEYDALFSPAKTPRILFTQPQKCFRLANKCIHGRRLDAEGSNDGCSRKLLFQPEKNCENVQFLSYHNMDQYKQPESARSLTSEDRRKNMLRDPGKMNKSSVISISVGVWRRELLEDDEQRKDTKSEFSLGSMTPVGGYSTRKEDFPEFDEDSVWNSTVYSMGLIEAAENGNQIQKSRQKLRTDVEYLRDFLASENSKRWADMVEEDDQELLNESKDLLAHEQGFPSQESVFSPKNPPINYSDVNEAGEKFADENKNPNMILETPCSLNQCESLNQKIESLVPRDGYYTQPLHAGSSMNLMARRLFYDNQYGNMEKVQTSFVSPLQKRYLNFERDNSARLEEDNALEDSEFIWRKRSEIFGDITRQSLKC